MSKDMPPTPPVERWRKVSDTAIEVNLDASVQLPFDGAEIAWQTPAGRGWVKVERVGDDLYVDGRRVIQHLEPEQFEGSLQGHKLRTRLQAKDSVDPRVLDALVEYEDGRLVPESIKQDLQSRTLFNYCWAVGFRGRAGDLYVRSLCRFGGRWYRDHNWLDDDFGVLYPALLLASA